MIKIDMPMPECCASCRFRDPDYGFCYADYEGRVINNKSIREEWCPLKMIIVDNQPKPKLEQKNDGSFDCYVDIPFPVCKKCSIFSPKLLHEKLISADETIDNNLHVICTNSEICINLIKMQRANE